MAFKRSSVRFRLAPPTFAPLTGGYGWQARLRKRHPFKGKEGAKAARRSLKSEGAAKYKPWRLVTYLAFSDEAKAIAFEHYLKTASGRAFANKRLR
jgi:hypothetical protein